MATIGTFTSAGNGFSGAIKTLNLNVKAKLVRVETPPTRVRTSASTRATSSSAPPGRRSPRTPSATTSRSSWTTRASPLRSMPP
jgi:hypothetical protein